MLSVFNNSEVSDSVVQGANSDILGEQFYSFFSGHLTLMTASTKEGSYLSLTHFLTVPELTKTKLDARAGWLDESPSERGVKQTKLSKCYQNLIPVRKIIAFILHRDFTLR